MPVNRAQQDHALELAHQVAAKLLLALLVQLMGAVDQHLLDFLPRGIPQLGGRIMKILFPGQPAEELPAQAIEIPIVVHPVVRQISCAGRGNRVVHHFEDDVLDIFPFQDFIALGVNDLALLVHNVVKIQARFCGRQSCATSTLACAFSMVLESILLSSGVFSSTPEGVHHVEDALAAEQPHEVVLERNIELASSPGSP